MSDDVIFSAEGIGKRFGGFVALHGISIALRQGRLTSVIGPNGAGKSTFFKMLTGQLQATSGAVLFRGEDISRAEPHEIARRGIGIKTQVPSVFDGLSVRENLWIAASRVHKGKRIRAAKLAKVPCFIVVGDAELEAKTVTVENNRTGDKQTVSLPDFLNPMLERIRERANI